MSKRAWIALSLAIAACCGGARQTLACGEPRLLLRPHAKTIADARQIFWAEVTGRQPIGGVDRARNPVRYQFKVLRIFKGQVGSTSEVDGVEDDPSDGSDTTFANHTAPEFWKNLWGRMAFGGDCTMVPPHFITGRRYLLVFGPPDLKQFERVDSEDDRWLKYVARKTAHDP